MAACMRVVFLLLVRCNQEEYVLDQQQRAKTFQETNKRVSEALNHLDAMRVSLRNQGSENS